MISENPLPSQADYLRWHLRLWGSEGERTRPRHKAKVLLLKKEWASGLVASAEVVENH